jgi:hypothetical protein
LDDGDEPFNDVGDHRRLMRKARLQEPQRHP